MTSLKNAWRLIPNQGSREYENLLMGIDKREEEIHPFTLLLDMFKFLKMDFRYLTEKFFYEGI